MGEMSTPENEALVSDVFTRALEANAEGRTLDAADLVVYLIESLSQEVNSGASFEQYFRWASVSEISQVVSHLQSLSLSDVARIVESAIGVAFPEGIPATDEAKEDLTEWTGEQEETLGALAAEFEEFNGRIINVLARYYRKSRPGA